MQKPSLRQLEYLTAIEDTGSFSAAADLCLVTQSTLSAGIKELEFILGQKVVERGKRQTTLTAFGQTVADTARTIFRDVDRILEHSKALTAPLTGPLRLGVIPTIAPYLLPKMLPALHKKFPALELQIHEDLTDRLLEKLRQNRLDIVLMAFPYDTPGLEQNILFSEDFMVICPKNKKTPKSYTIDSLSKEKLLLLEDGHCLRDHALSACKIQLPRQRKTFSATSLPTLIQMVSHGYGITLLPEMASTDLNLPPSLALVPFKKPRPSRQIGLAWQENSPKARDFELLGRAVQNT